MKSETGKLAAIEAAQRAAQSGIVSFVEEREAAVLNKAVAAYRGGTLNGTDAMALIGVISELRNLLSEAKRTIAEGRAAGETLTTQG